MSMLRAFPPCKKSPLNGEIFFKGAKQNLAAQGPLLFLLPTLVSHFWAPLKSQASQNLVFLLLKVNATCLTVGKLSLLCFPCWISHLLSFHSPKKIAFKIELVKSTGSLLNNCRNACFLNPFISVCLFLWGTLRVGAMEKAVAAHSHRGWQLGFVLHSKA